MGANGPTRPARGRAAELPAPATVRLPRAHLEEAFARLSEENVRLRKEVLASRSLWQIAHQDPLTALWNRRYADERLAEEMSRAKREVGYRFALVAIDVDNLKRINDQMGHASGDEALRWVARFLKQGLRGHDLCCRLGGDEFLLVLPGSGEQECRDLVERLHRRWWSAAQTDKGAVAISIGGASFPAHGSTVDALLGVADNAMYENKCRQDPARPSRPSRPARPARPSSQPADEGDEPMTPPPLGPNTRLVSY